jgi:glycerate 2-kinase
LPEASPKASNDRLRARAIAAFEHGLRACDPTRLVRAALIGHHEDFFVIAIGKAAFSMAAGVSRMRAGILVAPRGYAGRGRERIAPARWQILEAAHPIPDAGSVRAGTRIVEFVHSHAQGPFCVLLSGGASSLFCSPNAGLSLATLRRIHAALLSAGLSIGEINAVRARLEQLKGGGLRRLAPSARWRTLLLADVMDNDASVIGSGPTLHDSSSYAQAAAILRKAGLGRYVKHLRKSWPTKRIPRSASARILADYRTLGHSAGRFLRVPFRPNVPDAVPALAQYFVRQMRHRRSLVACSEPRLNIGPAGRGGRAQHLALLVAREIAGLADCVFFSAGSDGIDGNTDAAGAVVDGTTWINAHRLGLEPEYALRRFDAYPVLDRLGVLVKTGPTGNNLNDLHIVLSRKKTNRAG